MGFTAYIIEKIQVLIGNHYQLHCYRNRANYLKSFWITWTFLDLNLDEVYDITISVLQLILLIISSQKLANLLHL